MWDVPRATYTREFSRVFEKKAVGARTFDLITHFDRPSITNTVGNKLFGKDRKITYDV